MHKEREIERDMKNPRLNKMLRDSRGRVKRLKEP